MAKKNKYPTKWKETSRVVDPTTLHFSFDTGKHIYPYVALRYKVTETRDLAPGTTEFRERSVCGRALYKKDLPLEVAAVFECFEAATNGMIVQLRMHAARHNVKFGWLD